jgi:hypothetical protein
VVDVRQYDEKAVAAILQRAAELDRKRRETGTSLSLAEIEQIARDAGIDPAVIRQAARDVEHGGETALSTRLASAPLRRTIERVVDHELSATDHERLAVLIRQGVSPLSRIPPQVSSLGRSLTLSAQTSRGFVEVQVTPQGAKTLIRITVSLRSLAGSLFGPMMGPLGVGFGSFVCAGLIQWITESGLPLSVAVPSGVLGWLGTLGGTFSLARLLFSRTAKRTYAEMDELADRLEAELK